MSQWIPGFESPELLLLGVPLWLLYRRVGAVRGMTGRLRIALLALLLICLAGPYWDLGGEGLDVVLVVDRSRSMPTRSEERVLELIANVEARRQTGDRLALVTFGARTQIEHGLSGTIETSAFTHEILPDGSDLNDAILTGLSLLDPRRPARVLVLSDGEANGAEASAAARRARELGVPIDFRPFERMRVGDVAITELQLPQTLFPREQFQFAVIVDSDLETQGELLLQREGVEIARQPVRLRAGVNTVRFRDRLDAPGFFRYAAELQLADDPVRENNRGEAGVRVRGAPRLLVLNPDGVAGNLVRAFRAGQLEVDVAVAATHPLTQDSLDAYRAVVLENVPARDLGRQRMERLAQFVEDLGGGLMVTGGQQSFGAGGYFRSPLDPLLPVSMELREDNRQGRLALAIALDNSGSMNVTVGGGLTKMELANQGSVECIRLLSAGDSVSLLSVDTQADVVQPLTDVENRDVLILAAESIRVGGGGIFVYEALEAAYEQLREAEQETRHLILFADAADSKRPGNYQQLLGQMLEDGITVSVIGLGSPEDSDAALLQDIAALGEGNIMFTRDPRELPRLFSEDAMSVARSSFVECDPEVEPAGIPGELLPDARLMGAFEPGKFPGVYGYNLCDRRPGATVAVASRDEFDAPWSAFWYRGVGRVAALTMEVDGRFQGPFGDWSEYADFLVTHGRWLLGTTASEPFHVTALRDGLDAVITLELDPAREGTDEALPGLRIIPPGAEREAPLRPDFLWIDEHRLQSRFRMDREGTWRTLLQFGQRDSQQGPAVSLPYSPEFFPRRDLPTGFELLDQLAEISGGHSRTDVGSVFDDPPRVAARRPLLPWLLPVALLLLLTEIAGRRLDLWKRPGASSTLTEDSQTEEVSDGRTSGVQWKRIRRRRLQAAQRAIDRLPESGAEDAEPDSRGTDRVFDQAKRRARRRLTDQ